MLHKGAVPTKLLPPQVSIRTVRLSGFRFVVGTSLAELSGVTGCVICVVRFTV